MEFAIAMRRALSSVKKNAGMSNLRGANQAGRPLLTPPLLELDVKQTKELGVTFALVASNDDMYATTFKVLGCKGSNTAQATRPEVDVMGGCLWEISGLGPVDWRSKNLFTERTSDGRFIITYIRP